MHGTFVPHYLPLNVTFASIVSTDFVWNKFPCDKYIVNWVGSIVELDRNMLAPVCDGSLYIPIRRN